MPRRFAFAPTLVACVLFALPAAAQDVAFFAQLTTGAPVEGKPGCTWQWTQGTVGPWGGWYHACDMPHTPASPAVAPPLADVGVCGPGLNPYTPEGAAEAVRCYEEYGRQNPPPALPVFKVGSRYVHAYPSQRMVVLAVTLGLDGVQVVTGQWLTEGISHVPGDVFAFRNAAAGGEWREVVE